MAPVTWTDIKAHIKRNLKWYIIGAIAIVLVIVLAILIPTVIVPAIKSAKAERFIQYNPADANHAKLNIKPEATYIETYIKSSLGLDDGK